MRYRLYALVGLPYGFYLTILPTLMGRAKSFVINGLACPHPDSGDQGTFAGSGFSPQSSTEFDRMLHVPDALTVPAGHPIKHDR
jgi:hypothetical protein